MMDWDFARPGAAIVDNLYRDHLQCHNDQQWYDNSIVNMSE